MPRGSQTQNARRRANELDDTLMNSQASQCSSSRRRRHYEAGSDEDGASQSTQSQARTGLSKEELDRKVADFVRYMLFMDAKKTAVKRADITKNVLKEHSHSFEVVFEQAQKKIKKTFGFELVETKYNKQKAYILISRMPHELRQIVEINPDDQPKMGLLLVILAMIFMMDNVLSEEILWQTLKRLGVIKGKIHEIFGDVEKLITTEFVRQMYLDRKKIVTGDTAAYEYRWGARAEQEISKKAVLEFVATVYGTGVEAWTAKYKEVFED